MRESRPLVQNLGLLGFAQVTAQALNLVALVFLARHLGGGGFGLVQVGVAVSAYAMITAEWGLFSLGIRDVARLRRAPEILAYARRQQGLLLLLGMAVLVAGWFLLPLFPFYHLDPTLFRLYLLMIVPQVLMQEWIATGLERMAWVARVKISASLLYVMAVVLLTPRLDGAMGWPAARWIPVFYLISYGLAGFVVAWPVSRLLGGWVYPALSAPRTLRELLTDTAPIGASIVTMRVLINGDLIMLGILSRPEVAGVYAASAKIGFLVVVAMEVLWKALLPRLARRTDSVAAHGFQPAFTLYFGMVLAGLIPAVGAGFLAGPDLMVLLYGPEYTASGSIFRILAVSYSMLAAAWFLGNSLLAADRQRETFPPLLAAALASLAGHLILVPRYDGVGAAWAMLVGHGMLLILLARRCRSWGSRKLWTPVGVSMAGTLALSGLYLLTGAAPLAVRLAAGILGYAALAWRPTAVWIRNQRMVVSNAPAGGSADRSGPGSAN